MAGATHANVTIEDVRVAGPSAGSDGRIVQRPQRTKRLLVATARRGTPDPGQIAQQAHGVAGDVDGGPFGVLDLDRDLLHGQPGPFGEEQRLHVEREPPDAEVVEQDVGDAGRKALIPAWVSAWPPASTNRVAALIVRLPSERRRLGRTTVRVSSW